MKNSTSSILIPTKELGWQLLQNKKLRQLVHQASGRTFDVNEITQSILDQCDGLRNVGDIISHFEASFPDDATEIEQDVKLVLRKLAMNGVISFAQISRPAPVIYHAPAVIGSKQVKLCIGMATYDDYDGVYFSVQAIRLYHPEVLDHIEFVVLDNNPTGKCAKALKNLGNSIPNYRYIEGDNFQGTWSRFSLLNHTNAPYFMCIDSHVMILPGAIKRLIDYFDTNHESPDFLQGPLLNDNLISLSSHFTPGWSGGMYGTWANHPRANDIDGEAFDIPMQGLGLFALRTNHWPVVNPRFNGFGGEEGYVHEKIRRAGGRTLCLPFLRWIHRFSRPMGAHYALNWEDRIRNYLIAYDELGIDNSKLFEHFQSHIGVEQTALIKKKIESEIDNPFYHFDAIFCINLDDQKARWLTAHAQFEQLGIAHRVQRLAAVETPENHHVGCALSHRLIIQISQQNQYQNVLVLEDDVVFDTNTLAHLSKSMDEAKNAVWDVLYLGGRYENMQYPLYPDSQHLLSVTDQKSGPTCTHALAYNRSAFSKILQELPDSVEEMKRYLEVGQPAIDQYLATETSFKRLLVDPLVAYQPWQLTGEPKFPSD